MSPPAARERFLALLRTALADGTLTKLTLGKYRGADSTLRNLFVRPVALKSGPHLAFVWRHATRDTTKNHLPAEALAQLEALIGADFLDAHLFTAAQTAQLETQPDGTARLKVGPVSDRPSAAPTSHDRAKHHLIPADAPWLRTLGVTNDRARPREGMTDKFSQIQKFAELLSHLIAEAFPGWSALPPTRLSDGPAPPQRVESGAPHPLLVLDAGSGKGYLTFAVATLLGPRATVRGIEVRPELVDLCNRAARENQLAHLTFAAGTIADAAPGPLDVLLALHACDTATDDALAKGIVADARLLVVAPCCQKELRPQLTAPPVLADALRHGIFQERTAEFVTDALRAQLLEWAGYKTKVFEFISTEHTAKNLMIAAIKSRPAGAPDDATAQRLRAFAAFYGIRTHRLAAHLGFSLQCLL
ncbi:MAG: SAM-dependent methyltransferase [Verrucomicrobia bacterium]|nr:SAM-dependent methyltransferase [Verrucomicrobiota bacterium]